MHKKIIQTDDYQGKDRRLNDFPELTANIKSWWPIWTSLAGLLVIIGVWLTTVKTTAVLANNTACDVKILDTRVTRVETMVGAELPILKDDVSVIKNDVKQILQTISSLKTAINYHNGNDR